MLLKHRFPLFFSLTFSLLLAVVLFAVYYLFAQFRNTEFKDRLAEKAESTIKLLLEVKEVDRQLLRIIDTSSINRLYNEKTIIFNDSMHIIYSSIDDMPLSWTAGELNEVKNRRDVWRRNGTYDVLGMHYAFEQRDYYVFISAEDRMGIRKLHFLKLVLLSAALAGTLAVWLIAFYVSKKSLEPLNRLSRQMQEITSKSLMLRVPEQGADDEIRALSRSFNQMLQRIDKAYKAQKDFTSNASHELRTPLTRIVMQLENLLQKKDTDDQTASVLLSVTEDVYHLSDIVTSLLLLSKLEHASEKMELQAVRLDEVLFHAAAQLSKTYPDFKLFFDVEDHLGQLSMEVKGDETLLKIVLTNLLKNGYTYSDNKLVHCTLYQDDQQLQLVLTNTGTTPSGSDTTQLFNPFHRGSNSTQAQGSGIGLSIVQRILEYHHATVSYEIPDPRTNRVVLSFPLIRS